MYTAPNFSATSYCATEKQETMAHRDDTLIPTLCFQQVDLHILTS